MAIQFSLRPNHFGENVLWLYVRQKSHILWLLIYDTPFIETCHFKAQITHIKQAFMWFNNLANCIKHSFDNSIFPKRLNLLELLQNCSILKGTVIFCLMLLLNVVFFWINRLEKNCNFCNNSIINHFHS